MTTKIHTYEFKTVPGDVMHLQSGNYKQDTIMCSLGADVRKPSGELVVRSLLNEIKSDKADGLLVITHDGMRASNAFVKVNGRFEKVPRHKAEEYYVIINHWLSMKNGVRTAA